MTASPAIPCSLASDALLAAALLAVDPFGLAGVTVGARAGPVREHWLACLRHLAAPLPWRSLPLHITDERLLGGLDLAATLHTGRPVAQRGVLASADGGIVEIVGAERMTAALAARIGAVLDRREVAVERDGLKFAEPTRFGVVMLDESAQGAWPLRATVFALGLANGAYAVAAIGTMMGRVSAGRHGREGVRMGLWGAAQAVAFGLGGLAGTLIVDLVRILSGSPAMAYASVFALEAALFVFAAALAAGPVFRQRELALLPDSSRMAAGEGR